MTKQQQIRQAHEISAKFAQAGAVEWIDELIATHERAVQSLKSYRARFVEACEKPDTVSTPVNVLSWTVNEVQNVQRNLRLDLVANHASALAITAAALSQK